MLIVYFSLIYYVNVNVNVMLHVIEEVSWKGARCISFSCADRDDAHCTFTTFLGFHCEHIDRAFLRLLQLCWKTLLRFVFCVISSFAHVCCKALQKHVIISSLSLSLSRLRVSASYLTCTRHINSYPCIVYFVSRTGT
jgi:hypothetical protein